MNYINIKVQTEFIRIIVRYKLSLHDQWYQAFYFADYGKQVQTVVK